MEEKKLADDKEVIRLLEIFASDNEPDGVDRLAGMALDLIHRLQYGYSSASKASDEWREKYEKERKENEDYNQKLYDGELLSKDYHDEQVFHYVDENAELREEIKTLKAELKKELAEHEEFTKKAKAEIERLTEERNKYKGLYETMYRKYSVLQDKDLNCEKSKEIASDYLNKCLELQEENARLEKRNSALLIEKDAMEANCIALQKKFDGVKTIGDWVHEIHKNAVQHGWYDGNGAKNFGELLMLVVTEVAEVMEEYRNGRLMKETYVNKNGKMCGIPSELADIVIRVMDICGYYNIDLEQAIEEKHEYNKSRPYKHGGKKC